MSARVNMGKPTMVTFGIPVVDHDPTVLPVELSQSLDEPFDEWSKRFTDHVLANPDLPPYLEVEHEVVEIRFATTPMEVDPDWRYVDEAGHLHAYVDGKTPTLEWVVDRTWWCEDCGENHEDGHLACKVCREEIEPGRKPGPSVQHRPGRVSYSLCGQPIAREDAERVARILGIPL